MTGRILVGLLALLLPLALLGPAGQARAATPTATPTAWSDAHGLRVVSATRDGDRLWRLVVASGQLATPVRVNVLLPEGYGAAANADRRYPVLHLFHGTNSGADDWISEGGVLAASAPHPMIVVLPDAGHADNGGSFFTDWLDQRTPLGAARWETFHVDELVPYVDSQLRTDPRRAARAVAGLSQGGYGALSYAARHPDTFVSAASFSGPVDLFRSPDMAVFGTALVSLVMTAFNRVQPFAPFGDPVLHRLRWEGHNPAHLVDNLRATDLGLWSGNGQRGPLDGGAREPRAGEVGEGDGGPIEAAVEASTRSFVRHAGAAGITPHVDLYGPGTHTWPYWERSLTQYLPRLQRVFDERRPPPEVIGHRATERSWEQYGWRVENLALPAWTGLADASADGFTVEGAATRVSTPPLHVPGARYDVRWTRGTGPGEVTADAGGRLTLEATGDRGLATALVTASSG